MPPDRLLPDGRYVANFYLCLDTAMCVNLAAI